MNRLGNLLLVALVPLLVAAAVYTSTALASRPALEARPDAIPATAVPATVTGTVVWGQLVVLSPEARVSVRLVDISRADGSEVTLGEYVANAAGRGYPAQFNIQFDPSTIRPGGLYAVVGDIVADDTLLFRSTTRMPVITRGAPTEVHLFLSKVGPWSPFDLAVSSGQLARASY
ncbi:MAG: YbaY family lipoprotein [Anaerolineae bacterium]